MAPAPVERRFKSNPGSLHARACPRTRQTAFREGKRELVSAPQLQLERYVEKLVREFGDTLMSQLCDPATEDIVLNPDGKLWVKTVGESFRTFGTMPSTQALSAFGTLAAIKGTVIHHDQPVLETDLPIDGSRFQALIQPVVSSPVFAIRCRPKKVFTLLD